MWLMYVYAIMVYLHFEIALLIRDQKKSIVIDDFDSIRIVKLINKIKQKQLNFYDGHHLPDNNNSYRQK